MNIILHTMQQVQQQFYFFTVYCVLLVSYNNRTSVIILIYLLLYVSTDPSSTSDLCCHFSMCVCCHFMHYFHQFTGHPGNWLFLDNQYEITLVLDQYFYLIWASVNLVMNINKPIYSSIRESFASSVLNLTGMIMGIIGQRRIQM